MAGKHRNRPNKPSRRVLAEQNKDDDKDRKDDDKDKKDDKKKKPPMPPEQVMKLLLIVGFTFLFMLISLVLGIEVYNRIFIPWIIWKDYPDRFEDYS